MSSSTQEGLVAVCTYRVMAGQEETFERLLKRHAPTLRSLALITDLSVQPLRCAEPGEPKYVEVFEWVSVDAAQRASEIPEVIAIWEPMAALCETRDGLPGLEFPFSARIEPGV